MIDVCDIFNFAEARVVGAGTFGTVLRCTRAPCSESPSACNITAINPESVVPVFAVKRICTTDVNSIVKEMDILSFQHIQATGAV